MRPIPKVLFIIVVGAALVRLILFLFILGHFGEGAIMAGDSKRFYIPAINLLTGHGFSQSIQAPFLPHADFPPLYSFFIAGSLAATGSLLPLIILQILLSSLFPLLIWRIGDFLTDSSRIKTIAAVLAAFEPQMMLWSFFLITEVMAVFFLLLSVYYFLKLLSSSHWSSAVFSGTALALSTLTRPHAQFLFILGFVFLLTALFLKRSIQKNLKKEAIVLLAFSAAFLLVLTPWLARNYYNFQTVTVSTTGLRNVYVGIGTSIISYKNNQPYNDAQEELIADLKTKYGVTKKDIYENPASGGLLFREGLKIIWENPGATLGAIAVTLNSFFTQDLYLDNARHFNLIPNFSFGLSPSLVLVKEGPLRLAELIKEKIGWYAILPALARVFWVAINGFWITGAIIAFRQKGNARRAALIFAALILYYALVNLMAGFADQGRLRYPVNGFMFLLASFGLVGVLKNIRPKFLKARYL